jgi:hypothetical protein
MDAPPLAHTFRALSRIRGKRIFHPHGVGFRARLEPLPGADVEAGALTRPGEAIVRLSRSVGLPEALPDPCGLALRIADAYGEGRHQDLLLVSSGEAPVTRHALLPARGFADRHYSSLLPYRAGGETVVIGARALATPSPGPLLADLAQRDVGGIEFALDLARPASPDWTAFATLSLRRRIPDAEVERIGFDPTNTGGGLGLVGLLNRIRGPAYAGSQAGRCGAYAAGPDGG